MKDNIANLNNDNMTGRFVHKDPPANLFKHGHIFTKPIEEIDPREQLRLARLTALEDRYAGILDSLNSSIRQCKQRRRSEGDRLNDAIRLCKEVYRNNLQINKEEFDDLKQEMANEKNNYYNEVTQIQQEYGGI